MDERDAPIRQPSLLSRRRTVGHWVLRPVQRRLHVHLGADGAGAGADVASARTRAGCTPSGSARRRLAPTRPPPSDALPPRRVPAQCSPGAPSPTTIPSKSLTQAAPDQSAGAQCTRRSSQATPGQPFRRFSGPPWAVSSGRNALHRSGAELNELVMGSSRPGRRPVTSRGSQMLPSGSFERRKGAGALGM
jgi:hypothetical protein